MVRWIVYDGVSSRDYLAVADGSQSFAAPERSIERVEIPGRNGDLTIDNKRYLNVELVYTLHFRSTRRMELYRRAMLSKVDYHRLEDSKRPEEFRLARLVGFEPTVSGVENRYTELVLTFDCKPQRFLHSGERPIHFETKGATIRNPGMPSKPLIAISGEGAGTVTVGGVTVELKDTFAGLTLDCDTMDAYQLESNKNKDIKAATFPEIPTGDSTVSWTGGVTAVDITPRWWRL